MSYPKYGRTFEELREANEKRLATTKKYEKCKDWTASDWIVELFGEAGELSNNVKKLNRGDAQITLDKIAEELADVVIVADLIGIYFQIDLAKAVTDKFNKTSEKVGSDVYLG